ncbi:S-layer homology domain-containing protein [Paenibacillus chartarius]|uniref:S-layer homology domain-containing protein n=1 Tax=Paenibacillus chartarius TaxID=747481 RepID=A0ABV6DDZ0_9BACL
MKKLTLSVIALLIVSLVLLPFAFAAETGSGSASAVKRADDFVDLKDLPQDEKDKFDAMIQGGVFNGMTEDTFGLDVKMNRAQFAKVASIIFKLSVDEALTASSFEDVKAGDWSLPYIEALKKAGLTNGYDAEGKQYNPNGEVSRQELAAFLIRGLGLEEEAKAAEPVSDSTVDDWAKGYAALALEKNLLAKLDNGTFGGKQSATRKMLALASYAAKQIFEGGSVGGNEGGGSTATPPPATNPGDTPAGTDGKISPEGKKMLFITRQSNQMATLSSNPEDEKIIARMKALGFRVTWINCDKVTLEKTAGYDIIYVSATVNSKYFRSAWMKDVAIPTVYAKNHGMYYLGLSSQEENTNEYNIKSISIADPKDEAAAGLSGAVDVLRTTDPKTALAYGIPGKEAKKVATIPGKDKLSPLYYYNKGSKADSGFEVKARTSYIFISGSNDNLTDDALKLLDNLVVFTLQNK